MRIEITAKYYYFVMLTPTDHRINHSVMNYEYQSANGFSCYCSKQMNLLSSNSDMHVLHVVQIQFLYLPGNNELNSVYYY